MKAHITKQEDDFEAAVKDTFTKVQRAALASGAKAIAAVIYDKATDATKSYKKRVEDIIKFCETGLNIKTEGAEIQ